MPGEGRAEGVMMVMTPGRKKQLQIYYEIREIPQIYHRSGQITIIPWGDSLTKPPFGVTSAEVVIICPDRFLLFDTSKMGPI